MRSTGTAHVVVVQRYVLKVTDLIRNVVCLLLRDWLPPSGLWCGAEVQHASLASIPLKGLLSKFSLTLAASERQLIR